MPRSTEIEQPEVWEPGFTRDKRKYRFQHNAHQFTLFLRDKSPYWQIKFRHKIQQRTFSLGTNDWKLAKKRAIARYEEIKSGDWERRSAAGDATPVAQPFARIGDILARYRKGIVRANMEIGEDTANSNALSLERFLHYARPGSEEVSALSSELLSQETTMDAFKTNYLAPAGENVRARESRKRGGNSVLRQARAVFSAEAMKLYTGIKLPDLALFKQAKGFDAKPALVIEIPESQIAAMARAAREELRELNPALYLAHLCFRHCGMRNVEIASARWSWLVKRDNGAGWMMIDQTEDFDAKGTLGRVPVPKDVMAEMERLRGVPEDYVIAAATPTERAELVNRGHSAWVKKFLDGSSHKTSYRLRKFAGDVIRMKYNDDASRAFLRHSDKSVAGKHYWSGYNWDMLAKLRGDDATMIGVTLADCGLFEPSGQIES